MLRINSLLSASDYYTKSLTKGDYYSEQSEINGKWGGLLANELGLGEEVKKSEFDNLCAGRHPYTGEKLTSRLRSDRREAYDFIFSVPKSVSLLGAITRNSEIERVITESVIETMKQVEQNMQCRVRGNGKQENRVTGNMVYGYFLHRNSRPIDGYSDPQLHVHAVVLNLTLDKVENKWKAIEVRDKIENREYYNAIFNSTLALKLKDIGLPVDKRRGDFEITGITDKTIETFSRRTEAVENEAILKNIHDDKIKDNLGARTRHSKNDKHSQSQLREIYLMLLSPQQKQVITNLGNSINTPSPALQQTNPDLNIHQIQALQNRPIIVDADHFKKIHSDYLNDNHHIYGKMAKEVFFEALEIRDISKVVFTAGGSGSGKSEIILKRLAQDGFDGIIVDGTLANYNQAVDNITRSLSAGKHVEIRGIIPDLERAYGFVLKRETDTGRGVPLDTFLDKQFGFLDSFPKIMKHFEANQSVKFGVYDKRIGHDGNLINSRKVILDIFSTLRYDKVELEIKLNNYEQKYRSQNPTNTGELQKLHLTQSSNPNESKIELQPTNTSNLELDSRAAGQLHFGQDSQHSIRSGERTLFEGQNLRSVNEGSTIQDSRGRGDLFDLDAQEQSLVRLEQSRLNIQQITQSNTQPSHQTLKHLDYTLEKAFERHSSMSEQRLIGEVLKEGVGKISLAEVNLAIEKYKEDNILVSELKNPKNTLGLIQSRNNLSPAITTKVALIEEQRIITHINQEKRIWSAINSNFAKNIQNDTFLNENQKIVISKVLTSRDGVSMIEGKAGTGKTTILKEIAKGVLESKPDQQILILAPTTKAVEVLQTEGFPNAMTVQKFLVTTNNNDQNINQKTSNNKSSNNQNPDNTSTNQKPSYIIVDEASLVSVRQMDKLLKKATEIEVRVLLVGDTKQHKSVERGNTLQTIIDHSKIEVFSLHQIQRQKESEAKQAVELLANGQTIQGINQFQKLGCVKEIENDQQRLERVAQLYIQNLPKVYVNKVQGRINTEDGNINNIPTDELKGQKKSQNQSWLQKMSQSVGQRLFGQSNFDQHTKGEQKTEKNEIRQIKVQYEKLTPQQNTLVVTPTHLDGQNIHSSIRQKLKAEKLIDQQDHNIETLHSLSWTDAEKGKKSNYQLGQVLQFNCNIKKFKNGEKHEVIEPSLIESPDNKSNSKASQSQQNLFEPKLVIKNLQTNEQNQLPISLTKYFDVLKKEELVVSKGDLIQLLKTATVKDKKDIEHKTMNGATYQIKHISPRTGDITLSNDWILPKDFGNLKSAYYSTSHASQGQTVNHSIFYTSNHSQHLLNQDMVYVANSRFRLSNTILTPNLEQFKQYAQKPDLKSIALEVVEGKKVKNEVKKEPKSSQEVKPTVEPKKDLELTQNQSPTLQPDKNIEQKNHPKVEAVAPKRRMKM